MRVVIFTADPHLEATPWWRIVVETPEIDAILVCRRIFSSEPREVLRRFRRNVKKHGLVFIPVRIGLLALSILRRPFRNVGPSPVNARVPADEIEATDIHAPEVLERVRAFAPDLGLSLGAPILKPSLFSIPTRGTLNLHCGKVPEFRGAPPAFWELWYGATSVGATMHWVDAGLDTGAIVASADAPIYPADSLAEVEARVTELGSLVFRQALAAVIRGDASSRPQPTGGATHRFPTMSQRWKLSLRLASRRLRRRLAPRRLSKVAAMSASLYLYRPLRDVVRSLRRRHPVRVFTFHRVTWLCRDGMTVDPAAFRRQVAYIARHHDIVSLERGVALIREGARLRRPAAVLTFDDAYRTVFDVARSVLAELSAPGCSFVATDFVGTEKRFAHDEDNPVRPFLDVMSWHELSTLKEEGWSFGAHTASHARLSECAGQTLEHEIQQPRRVLREQLQLAADVIAFPFGHEGDISEEAKETARRMGHTTMFANYAGENPTGSTAFMLGRYDIGADRDVLAWKNETHGIELGRWRGLWPG